VAVFLVVVLVGAGSAFQLWSIFNKLCDNEVLATELSPDKAFQAVVFIRDCGATTRNSIQVSILRHKQWLPNDPGNLFIAEAVGPTDGTIGGPEVKVTWTAPRAVRIEHRQKARLFLSNSHSSGVSAVYSIEPKR
jgi:hypothetical protein